MEGNEYECISEHWLLENLPHGWSYDCTFTPEAAFVIYSNNEGGGLVIPLRLLAPPSPSLQAGD
jgi:hypothetical protein